MEIIKDGKELENYSDFEISELKRETQWHIGYQEFMSFKNKTEERETLISNLKESVKIMNKVQDNRQHMRRR